MDPLTVKWRGPNHLKPYYFCELSLHPKFQSPSITPSYKKAGVAEERRRRRRRKKKKQEEGKQKTRLSSREPKSKTLEGLGTKAIALSMG